MLRNQFTPWAIRILRLENTSGTPSVGGGGSGDAGGSGGSGSGAAAGAPTPSAQPSTGGSSAGSPPAGMTPGGTPTPTPQTAAGQGDNAENLRVLRESHEAYKRLGDVKTVEQSVAAWNKQTTHYKTIATELEYTPESFAAAMAADPVATINQLNAEYAQHRQANPGKGGNTNPNARNQPNPLEQKVNTIETRLAQQRAKEANTEFDSEFSTMLKGQKALEGTPEAPLPNDVHDVLYDMVSETLKNDDEFMKAMFDGDKAKYQPRAKQVFEGVATRFFSVVNAYNAWQAKVAGRPVTDGQGNGNGQQKTEKLTLDDILTASPLAKRQMETMR